MRYEHHITLEKTIIQDDRFFKLSQDSLLLSDFAPEQKGRILDLGCGVGVLMILMLLKSPRAHALGLEITEGACELARLNLKNAVWKHRAVCLSAICASCPKGFTAILTAAYQTHRIFRPAAVFPPQNPPWPPPGMKAAAILWMYAALHFMHLNGEVYFMYVTLPKGFVT